MYHCTPSNTGSCTNGSKCYNFVPFSRVAIVKPQTVIMIVSIFILWPIFRWWSKICYPSYAFLFYYHYYYVRQNRGNEHPLMINSLRLHSTMVFDSQSIGMHPLGQWSATCSLRARPGRQEHLMWPSTRHKRTLFFSHPRFRTGPLFWLSVTFSTLSQILSASGSSWTKMQNTASCSKLFQRKNLVVMCAVSCIVQ